MGGIFFMARTRGLTGVGFLIVFIALILVAFIAATVVISTSGLLQQRGLRVGDEAQERVSSGVLPVNVVAIKGVGREVEGFEVLLQLDYGSEQVKLDNMLIVLGSSSDSQSLRFDPVFGGSYPSEAGFYRVEYVRGGLREGYLIEGDLVRVRFKSFTRMSEESESANLDVHVSQTSDALQGILDFSDDPPAFDDLNIQASSNQLQTVRTPGCAGDTFTISADTPNQDVAAQRFVLRAQAAKNDIISYTLNYQGNEQYNTIHYYFRNVNNGLFEHQGSFGTQDPAVNQAIVLSESDINDYVTDAGVLDCAIRGLTAGKATTIMINTCHINASLTVKSYATLTQPIRELEKVSIGILSSTAQMKEIHFIIPDKFTEKRRQVWPYS
jgi:archaellin